MLLPNTGGLELTGDGGAPAAVGSRAGGAGMENGDHPDGKALEGEGGALGGEGADADHGVGMEEGLGLAEVGVAKGEERGAFGGGEFIGGEIGAGGGHEDEGAIIGDEMVLKKGVGGAEAFGEETPKSAAAHFTSGAVEAEDGTLGKFLGGAIDRALEAEPVTDGVDFAEGHAGLGHAEGTGVHAEEDHPFPGVGIAEQVGLVDGPGVVERVIDVGHRRGEGQSGGGLAEVRGGGDQRVGSSGGQHAVSVCREWVGRESRGILTQEVRDSIGKEDSKCGNHDTG